MSKPLIRTEGLQMRNVWKGLIVGAVTGAAVGVLLDLPARARAGGAAAAELARERGPRAAETIASAAAAGADRVRQADLPRKVREAAQQADLPGKVREAAHTVAASDTAQSLRQASASAADAVSETAKSAAGTVADKARKTRARS
jgi:hypothetical protein